MKLGTYRHFKGNFYQVLGIALHSETEQEFVVYRALSGGQNLWIRPLTMFQESVHVEGRTVPRFSFVQDRAAPSEWE